MGIDCIQYRNVMHETLSHPNVGGIAYMNVNWHSVKGTPYLHGLVTGHGLLWAKTGASTVSSDNQLAKK